MAFFCAVSYFRSYAQLLYCVRTIVLLDWKHDRNGQNYNVLR